MRKTTIFRSSAAILTTAALMGWAAALQAQDTTQVQFADQRPSVHVVRTGETLWELAQRYLGDPFLWPEIYRINTTVVEDPHWIFPGEELRLEAAADVLAVEPPADTVAAPVEVPVEEPVEVMVPVAPAPPPTETAPTVFQRSRPDRSVSARMDSPTYRYRSVRRGEFYAAGFLTEEERLPWARVLGGVGQPALENLPTSSEARVFEEIDITAPRDATYQVGDSLLVASLSREVRRWGDVVVPKGIARVSNVAGTRVRAEVITQFGRVSDGQVALPLEQFATPGYVVPVPIENGATGSVIATRDLNQVPNPHDIVFIDLGRSDGVSLGDVFEVLRPRDPETDAPGLPWEPVAILKVVHLRERSASGFVEYVFDARIGRGDPVRMIRKMPS